jgi:hypothetical protein
MYNLSNILNSFPNKCRDVLKISLISISNGLCGNLLSSEQPILYQTSSFWQIHNTLYQCWCHDKNDIFPLFIIVWWWHISYRRQFDKSLSLLLQSYSLTCIKLDFNSNDNRLFTSNLEIVEYVNILVISLVIEIRK